MSAQVTPENFKDYLSPALQARMIVLSAMDTKKLLADLEQAEENLRVALVAYNTFRETNSPHLPGSGGSDSQAVRDAIAQLYFEMPTEEGKVKLSNKELKDAWIQKQRSSNKALKAAIEQSRKSSFIVEAARVEVENCRERVSGLKAVIALKTAQLNFLSGDDGSK